MISITTYHSDFHMRKLKHGEVKYLAEGHVTVKWQNWCLGPGSLTLVIDTIHSSKNEHENWSPYTLQRMTMKSENKKGKKPKQPFGFLGSFSGLMFFRMKKRLSLIIENTVGYAESK